MKIRVGAWRRTEAGGARDGRRPGERSGLHAAGAALAVLMAVALAVALQPASATAAGIKWQPLTLQQALDRAKDKNEIVMIDVFSDHCGQCKDMDEGFWNTPEGAELGEDLIAIKIESDKPEGIPLHRRYPILGLPAVIFLRPDGEEIGRVLGFRDRRDFIVDAQSLKSGIDPLPAMERALAASPSNLAQIAAVLEQYLYRRREADAQKLLDRAMQVDKARQSLDGLRALSSMAKYKEGFTGDKAGALALWKTIVEQYPTNMGVASGVSGSLKIAMAQGETVSWIDWICKIAEQYPGEGRLQYNVAIVAYHQGVGDPCLAKAARRAIAAKIGPPNMDSIAVVLEKPTRGK